MNITRTALRASIAAAGLAALAACGSSEEATTYKADVDDQSAGELIVSDPNPSAVPVDLPGTPMTPVPPEEQSAGDATAAPADD